MYIQRFTNIFISILFVFTILHAEIVLGENRGVIISGDNKTIAANSVKEKRLYPYNDTLEPLLGYSKTYLTKARGLESSMNNKLTENQDVQLTIDLSLQQSIEEILDGSKKMLDADDIIVAVMESSTGKIISMGSSNRYDPNYLRKKDIPFFVQKFSVYPYEAGSIMKPLILALAIDKGLVEPDTVFNTYGGRYDIGGGIVISDYKKFDTLSSTDIIIHASNIGITQIAWLLSGYELYSGLKQFGFLSPSGIALPDDRSGKFRLEIDIESKTYRASTSFGYGLLVTFTQLLKSYNTFNNDGKVVVPQLILPVQKRSSKQVITMETAKKVHAILVENVKRGEAGGNAKVEGLEIGVKTATAHIFREGHYRKEYHSSCYGFANDSNGHKYTIAVLVVRPKKKKTHYASKSAVPVFKSIVLELEKKHFIQRETSPSK